MITICQAKNYKTRKNNIEKYIAPLPRLIIMNIPNCFVKTIIGRNTDELYKGYSKLKNFVHPQVSVHTHEISSHTSIISAKNTNIFILKLLKNIWWNEACDIYQNRKYYISSYGNKSFDVQWVFYKHH